MYGFTHETMRQADSETGVGHENVNVQAMAQQPTGCPSQLSSTFDFTGSGNCSDRSVTVLVALDEAWYDCSRPGGSPIWLWVHVAASNKVGEGREWGAHPTIGP